MIKTKLERDMQKANNGKILISINRIREIVGMNKRDVLEIIKDVDYIKLDDSRQRKYLVSDVAEAFMKHRVLGGRV